MGTLEKRVAELESKNNSLAASQYIAFRWEYNHRAGNVLYFSGSGGVTPPAGNTFGAPGALVCFDGTLAPSTGCGAVGLWQPDLRKTENRLNMAILVKF